MFLEANRKTAVPFTTSKVIAEFAGMNHRRVKDAIRKHKAEIESFGLLGAYETESSGGRPEEIVRLNEEQATFLMTLLKNTPTVVAFKKELVRQFFAMRSELGEWRQCRSEWKPIRRSLTDAVQASGGDKWDHKNYTDLAYRSATGKSAAQLRKERGAPPKAVAADYMTAEEIALSGKRQAQIAVLIDMGLEYKAIKAMLLNCGEKSIRGSP